MFPEAVSVTGSQAESKLPHSLGCLGIVRLAYVILARHHSLRWRSQVPRNAHVLRFLPHIVQCTSDQGKGSQFAGQEKDRLEADLSNCYMGCVRS